MMAVEDGVASGGSAGEEGFGRVEERIVSVKASTMPWAGA